MDRCAVDRRRDGSHDRLAIEGKILRSVPGTAFGARGDRGVIVMLFAYVFPGAIPHGLSFTR